MTKASMSIIDSQDRGSYFCNCPHFFGDHHVYLTRDRIVRRVRLLHVYMYVIVKVVTENFK